MVIRTAFQKRIVESPPLSDDATQAVLYVPVPALGDLRYLDYRIHEVAFEAIRAADLIVLRLHPSVGTALSEHADRDEIVSELSHRTAGVPTYLLTWREGSYSYFRVQERDWVHDDELTRHLAHAEFWSMLQQPGCILTPTSEFHYEGPNGSHFHGFVRPGLALLSTEALDGAAFWLLPYARPDVPIIADTGHLLGLAMHAQRYCASQLGGVVSGTTCDAVRGYLETDDEIEVRLARIRQETTVNRALIVISAKSTGRLERRLRTIAAKLWSTVDVVNLYGIRESGATDASPVLCTLPAAYRRFGKAPCELCREGVPLVRVDPHTYLLEVSAVAQRANVAFEDAAAAKLFMERYKRRGVVSLHRTRRDPHEQPRHHMVHLDISRMMDVPAFRDALRTRVGELASRFDVILTPSHPAAIALAKEVSKLSGIATIECDEEELGKTSGENLAKLRQSKGVVIVDDVVSTGTRLRGYKKRLREITGFDPNTALHLLVAVARPTSDKQFNLVRDMLRPGGSLSYVERVTLPDWSEKDCPWCKERDLLAGVNLSDSTYFTQRMALLSDTETGLSDEIFLRLDGESPSMALTESPVFGKDLIQAELFFVVASALQRMRNADRLFEYAQPPLARVLSPDGYLTGRYFEAIIDAAICRASRRFDLRTSSIEPELIAKVGRRLGEPFSAELRAELLFSIASGQLPPTPDMSSTIAAAKPLEAAVWSQMTGVYPGPSPPESSPMDPAV